MTALLAASSGFPSFFAGELRGLIALVDSAARALLVAGVVWAGLRLLGARHVVAQKVAWGLVLAGALLMPWAAPRAAKMNWLPAHATVVLPAHPWLNAGRHETRTVSTRDASIKATEAGAAQSHVLESAAPQTNRMDELNPDRFPAPAVFKTYSAPVTRPAHGTEAGVGYFLSVPDMAWLVYGVVGGVLLLRLLYGLGAAMMLWREAEPVKLEPSALAAGLNLRSSGAITSPVTVGAGIVLPADYDAWDAEKLRVVLAHERSHVRQKDFYLQALAGVYAVLFWFSPLGWWLKRKLSDLSEAISDRAGLAEAASHASYAQILLEFAAMPRRTQIGVAMARRGRISQRIERLLNESSFRQAFAGGRGRLAAALVLVPIALFAATALIRVEAARTLQVPASTVAVLSGQAGQESAPVVAAQAPAAPPAPAEPDMAPAPSAPAVPDVAPLAPPPAPAPPGEAGVVEDVQDQTDTNTTTQTNQSTNSSSDSHHSGSHFSHGRGYSYAYDSNGDSYAVVTGNDEKHINFSGDWYSGRRADLDKARAMAHGDFLWFTHDEKSYVVDDPQTVAQIQAMYKPMEELGRKQEDLGRQQEELGRQQEELGNQQERASIPAPDIAKEMADVNAAVAKLQAQKNAMITMDQLADLQGKIGELQGKLGGLQGEVGAKQGELGAKQGELGEQQGRLGAMQGRLGAEQGRIAHEADLKVKSIIDESLKNGKARPVQ